MTLREVATMQPNQATGEERSMESLDIARIARTRHTCKAFDATRKIDAARIDALRTVLQCAPSSVNSQPWHFFIASSDEGKGRVAYATQGNYAYNESKVRDASHVVVLCARTELDDAHVAAILAQEDRDGRFASSEARDRQDASRRHYVDLHREQLQDADAWMEKQVYIALGSLLQAAAILGIDACPIEGFDRARLDESLGLRARGLSGIVLAALGYRSDADFNARLPKSRLPAEALFTTI
jgi:nitroreductase/dihydropteridine reductase